MIEWHGSDVLNEIGKRIDANMLELGNKVVAKAQSLAPYKTGELRDSIRYDYSLTSHTLVFVVDAPYGIFQEYGTRHIRPHPYLRPALNEVGEIYGFNLEMAFANIPYIRAPILAQGAGFHLPSTLTAKQLAHVRKHLIPTSKKQFVSNVSRAKMHRRVYNY